MLYIFQLQLYGFRAKHGKAESEMSHSIGWKQNGKEVVKAPLHDTIRSCGACRLPCTSANRKVWHVSRMFRVDENRMTLNYSAFYVPAD